MRTSHLAIRRRIEQEALKLTDAEVFASGAYSAYLTDMAEAATKRYKRQTRVRCYYDESSGTVARTDNRVIEINAANFLTQSFPTRTLRSDSLVGMNGHEIGHILYTDFLMLRLYMDTLLKGRFYPAKPKGLTTRERMYLTELMEILRDKPEIEMAVVLKCAKELTNILEDVYVEARMCDAFPGAYRSGILLNNLRLPELTPSVTAQVDSGDYGFSIMMNLLIQYCKGGDINNLHGYSGPYLDALHDCVPVVDESVYDDDGRARYAAANVLLLKLWPFIKEMIDLVKKGKLTLEQLVEELGKQIVGTPGGGHDGDTSPVAFIPLVKTDEISEDGDGGVEYNRDYAGEDCASSGDDIARILSTVAEEKTCGLLEEELAAELQEEAERIRYGDAHKNIHVTVNRMSVVPTELMEEYRKVAPELLLLSRRMQKQVTQALKDQSEGGRLSGLLMGKRLNARALVRNDGRCFYNNRLPDGTPKLAVAVLVDESGSMGSLDRAIHARAAAIVVYDFCAALGIPVEIYGHTEWGSVELYAYAEFGSFDGKDRYRLMDIRARGGNRDGAALRFVAERLMKRGEQIRLLILISDGQPCADGYFGTEAEADLRGIKLEYKRKGITLFAAAIGDDKPNIERIYKDGFLDITDITRLPSNLTALIIRYIKT